MLQALTDKKSLEQISQLMRDKQYPATRILVKTDSTTEKGFSSSTMSAPSLLSGGSSSPITKDQRLLAAGNSHYSMRNSSEVEENINFPSHTATYGDDGDGGGEDGEGEGDDDDDDEGDEGEGEGEGEEFGANDDTNIDAFFDDDANQSIYSKKQSNRSIAAAAAAAAAAVESHSPSALSVSPSESSKGSRSPPLLQSQQHAQSPANDQQQQQQQQSGASSISERAFNDTYISDEECSPEKTRRGRGEEVTVLSSDSNGHINSGMGSPLFENLHSSRRHDEDPNAAVRRPSDNNRIDSGDQVSEKGRGGPHGSVRGPSSVNNSEDSSYMRRPYTRQEGGDGDGEEGEEDDDGEDEDGDDDGEEEDDDDDDDDDDGEEDGSMSHYDSQSNSNEEYSSSQYTNTSPKNRNGDGNLSVNMEENVPVGAALYVAKARKTSPRS